MQVDLTEEEVKDILIMINAATFQGEYAERVVALKQKLQAASEDVVKDEETKK